MGLDVFKDCFLSVRNVGILSRLASWRDAADCTRRFLGVFPYGKEGVGGVVSFWGTRDVNDRCALEMMVEPAGSGF